MTSMTTYNGPATVIAGGKEYPVTAELAILEDGGFKEWRGTLICESTKVAWDIFDENAETLLLIGDTTGVFIAGTFNADTDGLGIQGSGPAPFGGSGGGGQ